MVWGPGTTQAYHVIVLWARSVIVLSLELLCGSRFLGRSRLIVQLRGVDRNLLGSPKGANLKAFVDGSFVGHVLCVPPHRPVVSDA